MIEQRLYGMRVFTDTPLFDWPAPDSAVAPGEHPALALKPLGGAGWSAETPMTVPLYEAHERDLFLHTDRELALSTPGQPWRFEVSSVLSICWRGGEETVYYQLHRHGNRELLVFWFVHIFLPLHLTLERGYDFIHSAAVEVEGKPILFIAPSTGGKSTLGDYFLCQGHPMLSDDKVATFFHRHRFYAVPSHPHHRPFRQFEVLGNPIENYAQRPRPIHAFYVLEAGEPDSEVAITEVTGFRKFEQLLPNYLFAFRFLHRQRLKWLARLADKSVVFTIRRPWSLERMHETYTAICSHVRDSAAAR